MPSYPPCTWLGWRLDDYVRSTRPDQLILVVCSTRNTKASIIAEKVLQRKQGMWVAAATDGAVTSLRNPTAVEKTLDAHPCRIVLVDCAADKTIMVRYGFHDCPMYFWFFGGALIHAQGSFARYGTDEDALEEEVERVLKLGRARTKLADDFKFKDLRNATFRDISRPVE